MIMMQLSPSRITVITRNRRALLTHFVHMIWKGHVRTQHKDSTKPEREPLSWDFCFLELGETVFYYISHPVGDILSWQQ